MKKLLVQLKTSQTYPPQHTCTIMEAGGDGTPLVEVTSYDESYAELTALKQYLRIDNINPYKYVVEV